MTDKYWLDLFEHKRSCPPCSFDFLHDLRRGLRVVIRMHQDRAPGSQFPGNRRADAAGGASHQCSTSRFNSEFKKLLQTSSQFYDAETQSLLGFATLIDASSRIYARVDEVGKEEGRSLVFANGLRVSCKKKGWSTI
jgi:hypothetical protein